MREYQNLKSAVSKVLENASNVIVTKTAIKDEEDLKWALSKVIIQNVFIWVEYFSRPVFFLMHNAFFIQILSVHLDVDNSCWQA